MLPLPGLLETHKTLQEALPLTNEQTHSQGASQLNATPPSEGRTLPYLHVCRHLAGDDGRRQLYWASHATLLHPLWRVLGHVLILQA